MEYGVSRSEASISFSSARLTLRAATAVLAGFAFSGLLHDVVISVPAGAGYGRPTVFFAIQGLAVTLERSQIGRRIGLGRGAIGRSFVVATLVAPLGLLFHRPFILGIITPFMRAIGALSSRSPS